MKLHSSIARTGLRRLRILLVTVVIAMGIPAAILVTSALERLRNEAQLAQRQDARDVVRAINQRWTDWLEREEARPVGAYSFLSVGGTATSNFFAPSPLSQLPDALELPGLIGYFEIGVDGGLTSPVLPESPQLGADFGVNAAQYVERQRIFKRVFGVLNDNQLVASGTADRGEAQRSNLASPGLSAPQQPVQELESAATDRQQAVSEAVSPPQAQAAFDRLEQRNAAPSKVGLSDRSGEQSLDAVLLEESAGELEVGSAAQQGRGFYEASASPARRKEQSYQAVEEAIPASSESDQAPRLRVSAFESEVDPFTAAFLEGMELVLFRRVWTPDGRLIQGALLDGPAFLSSLVTPSYEASPVSEPGRLVVTVDGREYLRAEGNKSYSLLSRKVQPALQAIDRIALSAPLDIVQLRFLGPTVDRVPGANVILVSATALVGVLLIALWVLYRTGVRQLELAEEQRDFVAAVSHELKTPLTSIRMYSEMLRAGWADETKRRGYYDFIFDESERLSRLINNILQLSKSTHEEDQAPVQRASVQELLDLVRSRVSSTVAAAGFDLQLQNETDPSVGVLVNEDYFTQVMVNLVDNAVKFSRDAENKVIEIKARRSADSIEFGVRDYGPGVQPSQRKKVFQLFYRAESELTRETAGTGIGLALAHQLVNAMGGNISIRHRNPGVEFVVALPAASGAS